MLAAEDRKAEVEEWSEIVIAQRPFLNRLSNCSKVGWAAQREERNV